MDRSLDLLVHWQNLLPAFALVLTRISGLVMFVPFFSAASIPAKARALLAAMITLIVLPVVVGRIVVPATLPGLLVAMVGELMIGLTMGVMIALLFTGLELAGLVCGQQMGLALARVFDPLFEQEASVLGRFYFWLGMVIFLLINGHLILLGCIVDSFGAVPTGTFRISGEAFEVLTGALQYAFVLALKIAAPVVITLFLTSLAMGFIARTVPQVNILSIGFLIRVILGFIVIMLSLPAAVEMFVWLLDHINAGLERILLT